MNNVVEPKKNNRSILWHVVRWGSHIASLLPLLILIFDYFTNNLTANPIQAATQRTGKTALTILVIMLAVTPVVSLTKASILSGMKKRLGLYAFMYAAIHFIIFTVVDYGLNFDWIVQTLTQKPYLILGLAAFIILLLMAITSFQWWKRKMGKNWKRLHRLVYAASVLIVLHFALAQKGDLFTLSGNLGLPLLYGIVLLVLLSFRIPIVKNWITVLRNNLNSSRINK